MIWKRIFDLIKKILIGVVLKKLVKWIIDKILK